MNFHNPMLNRPDQPKSLDWVHLLSINNKYEEARASLSDLALGSPNAGTGQQQKTKKSPPKPPDVRIPRAEIRGSPWNVDADAFVWCLAESDPHRNYILLCRRLACRTNRQLALL